MKEEYPTLEKIKNVRGDSQIIGGFLDWLQAQGIGLYKGYDLRDHPIPYHYSIEKLLAEYYEIDLDEAEKERRKILENLQKVKQ